jgi:hypothetical protein
MKLIPKSLLAVVLALGVGGGAVAMSTAATGHRDPAPRDPLVIGPVEDRTGPDESGTKPPAEDHNADHGDSPRDDRRDHRGDDAGPEPAEIEPEDVGDDHGGRDDDSHGDRDNRGHDGADHDGGDVGGHGSDD